MKREKIIKLPARAHVPSTSIYTEVYTQSGSLGKRDVLILMPGGPGNDHTVCDYAGHCFAEEVVAHVDVILFDPRGISKSEKSAVEHCTLTHYIDDVEAIRSHYAIPADRLILMGVSYGGVAALGYGIRYASHLKKLLVVCGAVTSGEFIAEARATLKKIGTPAQQEMGERILTGRFTLSDETVAAYYKTMGPLYATTFDPTLPTPSISYNLELANLGFRTFIKEVDYHSSLSKICCPTLIIAGDQDWLITPTQAKQVHEAIPNSKLLIYENCGHMIWIDQWDRFLKELIQFLD